MKTPLSIAFASIVIYTLTNSSIATDSNSPKPLTEFVSSSEVTWEQLNPARGDKSPKAGTLWGNRNGVSPTGFLVNFVDGFESPPHIHNVAYRGVVISGLIHNDDPMAEKMWMRTSSFWTQPAGEAHITAAKGGSAIAYIEIEKGPYLVFPTDKTFDSGEKPINVDASNIVWIDQHGMPDSATKPEVAFLWGNPKDDQFYGGLIKLPAGFAGKIKSLGSTFRAVVIKGQLHYQTSEKVSKTLEPGSYFGTKGKTVHQVSSGLSNKSIIYIRTNGKLEVIGE